MIHANRARRRTRSASTRRRSSGMLPFYTRIVQVPITDDTSAVTFLKSTERVFLVLHEPDLETQDAQHDVPLRTIGRVTWSTAGVRPSNAARAAARSGPRHRGRRVESLKSRRERLLLRRYLRPGAIVDR